MSMKARNKWITKAMKRKRKKNNRGIVDLMMIMGHFFKELPNWINGMTDPRHESYTIYTQSDLVFMGLLKNMCGVKTMHSMDENFNEEEIIRTLSLLSRNVGLEEMPHCDTLNYCLMKLPPECLSKIRKKMVKSLLRMKSFYSGRLLGKYWRIILDRTGLFRFREDHCGHCLTRTVTLEDGRKVKAYYHKVLEARLVLSDRIVISIDTEFIENESEGVSKQDCEQKAAECLMERLKKDYPRLPVCIQGDALYAVEPVMKRCRENGWEYIFTQKEGRGKVLEETYEWIRQGGGATAASRIGKEKGTGEFVNHVEETAGKAETANICRYEYLLTEKGEAKTIRLSWVTGIELTEKNLEGMIQAGRGRWKIENEGFNNQKNGIYDIGH